MTKSLFEQLDQLVLTYRPAKEIDVTKAATDLPIPLHPGGYYREIGIVK